MQVISVSQSVIRDSKIWGAVDEDPFRVDIDVFGKPPAAVSLFKGAVQRWAR